MDSHCLEKGVQIEVKWVIMDSLLWKNGFLARINVLKDSKTPLPLKTTVNVRNIVWCIIHQSMYTPSFPVDLGVSRFVIGNHFVDCDCDCWSRKIEHQASHSTHFAVSQHTCVICVIRGKRALAMFVSVYPYNMFVSVYPYNMETFFQKQTFLSVCLGYQTVSKCWTTGIIPRS